MLNKGMKARQFVNVVMNHYGRGGSYSLSRIEPEKHLFYRSIAEAQAIAAEVRKKGKMTSPSSSMASTFMENLSPLPEPKLKLQPSRAGDNTLDFLPFYGQDSVSDSKILCVDAVGQAVLCDVDSGIAAPVPCLIGPKGASPISLCVTHANAADTSHADALYVMDRFPSSRNLCNFEALIFSNLSESSQKGWQWHPLPPPPGHVDSSVIQSYALLDGGSTICISALPRSRVGTYCFDTSSWEWRKAGSWTLPFYGRAEHVPDLNNLWFGIADNSPHNLCALDLSSLESAPRLRHFWRDLNPPEGWMLTKSRLLYLGNGRFCITKIFDIMDPDLSEDPIDTAAVLTGVEVVHEGPSKLRMIKHKSKCYTFISDGIQCVI